MPYVEKGRRNALDPIVQAMVDADVRANGDLNYILFKFARMIPQSYNSLKNYRGELHEAAAEVKRRLLDPYEDIKMKENGDVY